MATVTQARPAVFIGLGGAGTSVIVHLKRNFLNHFGANNPELQRLQFIALDTARPDYERIKRDFGDDFLREGEDWFSLGHFNPYREYQMYRQATKSGTTRSDYLSLKQWLDERAASRFFDREIEDGASADRQQGRLCLWKNAQAFETRLTQKIQRAYDLATAMHGGADATMPHLEVYVVTGSCGGTGSSSFLDVCYAVNRIYQSPPIAARGEPRVRGVVFLPFRYVAMQGEANAPASIIQRYQANGYGFFQELEYLLWDKFLREPVERRGQAMHRLQVNSEDEAVKGRDSMFAFRPFQMALLIDDKTDQNETIRARDLYPNTARALFHLFVSSATDSIESAYNNIEATLQALDSRMLKFGTVPAYASFGYRSVEFPREHLLRYLQDRFTYEALERGLLRRNEVKHDDMQAHVQDAAKRLVYDFLIQAGSDPTVENFEKLARRACGPLPDEVDLSYFYKDQENEDKEPKLDAGKVTVDELKKAVQLAEGKAAHAANVVKSEYLRMTEGDSSDRGLMRVRLGLKSLIDEQTPARGIRYVEELFYKLDVALAEKYVQLEKRLYAVSNEAGRLRHEILDQIDEVADKPKKRFEDFKRLLQTFVQTAIDQSILEHQLLFLKAVSKEEAVETSAGARKQSLPLVDQTLEQVKKIIRMVNDDIFERASEAYMRDLPKEFELREQDVMTEYVPRLTSLVKEGSFADRLYDQVVQPENEQSFASLMKEALRREDKAQGLDGLSFYLSDLFDQDKGGQEPARGAELLERLRGFAADKFTIHPETAGKLRRPLLEVIGDLPETEQKRIRDNFRAVRTLCPLDTARLDFNVPYFAYAFADEMTGRKLGLTDEDLSKRWARDDDPTKIVGLTLRVLLNKEGVAGLEDIEHIYRGRNRQANLPHIKKEWNDFGPKDSESADEKAGTLVLGLAFNYVVQKLRAEDGASLNTILSDEKRRTNRLQTVAPIFTRQNHRGVYEIIGCVPERDGSGRMMLKEDRNVRLSLTLDYKSARASLMLHPELEQAVEEFVQLVEDKLDLERVKGLLQEYYRALDDKHNKMNADDEQERVVAHMLDMLERHIQAVGNDPGAQPALDAPVV